MEDFSRSSAPRVLKFLLGSIGQSPIFSLLLRWDLREGELNIILPHQGIIGFIFAYNNEHLDLKSHFLPAHPSLRCQSVLTSVRTRRTGVTSLRAMISQITPCWGRRACSGQGVWVRKAWGGKGRIGTRARTMPSASLSSDSTSTDALKGKNYQSWSATAWGI